MNTNADPYVTDEAHGQNWTMLLGDSCERLGELDGATIDLSIFSPPFASLFTYSPSTRDLGNSFDRDEFLQHFSYVVDELLRVTKPGRLACIHVQQLSTTKATHGIIGLTDFRGQVIALFQRHGWIYHSEVTVDKCPQAQAIRTKSQALMFQTLHRDSASTRPALADYLIIMRAPGGNAVPIQSGVDNETWIKWARPVWDGSQPVPEVDEAGVTVPHPVWYSIRETDTLNVRPARESADEKHICPLQLPLIERCVRLWSNVGELVLSPFAGIGSEGYVAIKHGRRFVGVELKASYWTTACNNLRAVEAQSAMEFDAAAEVA